MFSFNTDPNIITVLSLSLPTPRLTCSPVPTHLSAASGSTSLPARTTASGAAHWCEMYWWAPSPPPHAPPPAGPPACLTPHPQWTSPPPAWRKERNNAGHGWASVGYLHLIWHRLHYNWENVAKMCHLLSLRSSKQESIVFNLRTLLDLAKRM